MTYFPESVAGPEPAIFKAIQDGFGFVPNFFRAQKSRLDFVEAEVGLVDAILLREGGLSRAQKEYIFLVCAASDLSTYCVTAHCEMVRMLHIEGPEPEQIAVDYLHSDIEIADKALLTFALKLSRDAKKIERRDIETLRTYGFTDRQIVEAIAMVGLSKFSTTVSFGLGTVPDFDSSRVQRVLGGAREMPSPAPRPSPSA
jgi:uncharacterized peroxidase-related enzyme